MNVVDKRRLVLTWVFSLFPSRVFFHKFLTVGDLGRSDDSCHSTACRRCWRGYDGARWAREKRIELFRDLIPAPLKWVSRRRGFFARETLSGTGSLKACQLNSKLVKHIPHSPQALLWVTRQQFSWIVKSLWEISLISCGITSTKHQEEIVMRDVTRVRNSKLFWYIHGNISNGWIARSSATFIFPPGWHPVIKTSTLFRSIYRSCCLTSSWGISANFSNKGQWFSVDKKWNFCISKVTASWHFSRVGGQVLSCWPRESVLDVNCQLTRSRKHPPSFELSLCSRMVTQCCGTFFFGDNARVLLDPIDSRLFEDFSIQGGWLPITHLSRHLGSKCWWKLMSGRCLYRKIENVNHSSKFIQEGRERHVFAIIRMIYNIPYCKYILVFLFCNHISLYIRLLYICWLVEGSSLLVGRTWHRARVLPTWDPSGIPGTYQQQPFAIDI